MNEQIANFLQRKWVIPAGVGVVAFGSGTGLGYFLGSKRWRSTALEALDSVKESVDIIEQMARDTTEDFLNSVLGPEETLVVVERNGPTGNGIVIPAEAYPPPDPTEITVDEEVSEKIDELLESGATADETYEVVLVDLEEERSEDPVVPIVFAESDDDWDFDVEVATRNPSEPYVLHKDEYFSNEEEYTQSTITWYEGDEVLVDSAEVPIYDRGIIGELKFGHGSGDQNVFYVRNDRLKAEYEVLRDRGHYAVEVLGMDDEPQAELRHSLRRFAQDD